MSFSGNKVMRLVSVALGAAALLVAVSVVGPASAQVAPPPPGSCTAQLSGSGTSSKVAFSAYVYQCKNASSMQETFIVLHGDTVVKDTEVSCPVNHLTACLGTAFSYSTTKPSGSKNWQFQVWVYWYPLVTDGTPIAKYTDSANVTS